MVAGPWARPPALQSRSGARVPACHQSRPACHQPWLRFDWICAVLSMRVVGTSESGVVTSREGSGGEGRVPRRSDQLPDYRADDRVLRGGDAPSLVLSRTRGLARVSGATRGIRSAHRSSVRTSRNCAGSSSGGREAEPSARSSGNSRPVRSRIRSASSSSRSTSRSSGRSGTMLRGG